jgi:solute carrier family 35 (UDP-sugar transporter), member A1/2/3
LQSITENILLRPTDTLKMFVPAILFLLQNGLFSQALGSLPAPVFQLTFQSKLILTAFLSVIILNHNYSIKQWLCLTTMSIGAALLALDTEGSIAVIDSFRNLHLPSLILGLVQVVAGCLASSFAGVYFEKILKHNANVSYGISSAPTSMWMRSIQLTFFTVLISLATPISEYVKRDKSLEDDSNFSIFQGFTRWTWILVCLQAIGGLLVIAVIGYADNVVKGIAIVMSQVVTISLSFILFSTPISDVTHIGSLIILLSVYYFNNVNNICNLHQEEESSPYQIQIV